MTTNPKNTKPIKKNYVNTLPYVNAYGSEHICEYITQSPYTGSVIQAYAKHTKRGT